jgi:hypothetical protein
MAEKKAEIDKLTAEAQAEEAKDRRAAMARLAEAMITEQSRAAEGVKNRAAAETRARIMADSAKVPAWVGQQARIGTYANMLEKDMESRDASGNVVKSPPGVKEEFVRYAGLVANGLPPNIAKQQMMMAVKRRFYQHYFPQIGQKWKDESGATHVFDINAARKESNDAASRAGTIFDLWQVGGSEAEIYIQSGGTQIPVGTWNEAEGFDPTQMSDEELEAATRGR